MSNLTIFNPQTISGLIDPFILGMSLHITPIKYEALTPDTFCMLFRTTNKEGQNYFFVSLEFDHLADLPSARKLIEQWHGSFIEFMLPQGVEAPTQPDLQTYVHHSDKLYRSLLARVEKPEGNGYWAKQFTIKPGDTISAKIAHLTPEQQASLRKILVNIFTKQWTDSKETNKSSEKFGDINTTDLIVSVYIKPEGGFELFYNKVY